MQSRPGFSDRVANLRLDLAAAGRLDRRVADRIKGNATRLPLLRKPQGGLTPHVPTEDECLCARRYNADSDGRAGRIDPNPTAAIAIVGAVAETVTLENWRQKYAVMVGVLVDALRDFPEAAPAPAEDPDDD
jgi:hypothetical protein